MRHIKKLFILILSFMIAAIFFCVNTYAANFENSQSEALGLDELKNDIPKSAENVLSGIEFKSPENAEEGLLAIKENIFQNTGRILKEAVKTGSALLAVALITSLAGMLCPGGDGKYSSYISLAGVCSVAVLTVGNTSSFVNYGTYMIDELYTFSKVLLPTLSAAAAAGGAVSSAAAQYAAAALFMDILLTLGNEIIVPLIYGYIIASISGAAFDNAGLNGAAKVIKWIVVSSMTAMVLSLTIYLTVSGTVLGTADDAAAKVAKTAISTALPIVGSIISDASGAVVGGINTLKNIIGIFGLVVVLAVCAVPFIKLAVNSVVFKIISAVTESISDGKIAKAVNAVGTAYAMILGLCGSAAIILFVSVISVLRTVTNI